MHFRFWPADIWGMPNRFRLATKQAPPVPLLGIAFVEDEVEILNDPTSLRPAGLYSGENSIEPALIFLSIVCGLHVQPSALAPANAQKTIPFRVLVMGTHSSL